MSVFLYAVTMPVSQIKTGAHPDEKRIISSERRFNYVVTFFFSENAKNLGRSDDAKQRKKRMALSFSLSFNLIKNQFFK